MKPKIRKLNGLELCQALKKARRMIGSCETGKQLNVAIKYAALALQNVQDPYNYILTFNRLHQLAIAGALKEIKVKREKHETKD